MFFFEILSVTTSTLLTIAALYIALVQYLHEKSKQKIERFELDSRSIKNDYTKLSEQAIDFYKDIYALQIRESKVVVNHLIYRPNWVSNSEQSLSVIDNFAISLIPKPEWLSDDRLTNSEISFRRRKINPYVKKSLVENILLHLDHKYLWDSPTYILDSIGEGLCPELQVFKSSYFNFYNSCLCFGYELAHVSNSPSNNKKKSYKFRKENDLFNLRNRCCALGTVTMTVFTNVLVNGNFHNYFVLHSRSESVAEGKNVINAVPAGTYQPSISSSELEPISLNILREFEEEIRGKKEFTFFYSIEEIDSNPFAEELKKNTYFLGMGFNPLNTYLEILTLLIIDLSKPVNAKEFGTTLEDIRQTFQFNFEGTLDLEEFNIQKLRNICATYHAAPSLKEIASILVKRLEAKETDRIKGIL